MEPFRRLYRAGFGRISGDEVFPIEQTLARTQIDMRAGAMAMQALLFEDGRDAGPEIDLSRQGQMKQKAPPCRRYTNLVMPGWARGATGKLPFQSR